MFTFTSFSDPASYPPLKVERPNPEYAAQMLANAASCNSEMTAISMYLYDSVVLSENAAEISNALKKMAVVEMHHLDIFLHLAFLLGAAPPALVSVRKPSLLLVSRLQALFMQTHPDTRTFAPD